MDAASVWMKSTSWAATAQTHEDLQGPPQAGSRQGHCGRHRRCHHFVSEEEEEQVKGSTV